MQITLTDQGYRDDAGQSYDRVSSVTKLVYLDDPFQFVKPKDMKLATDRGSAIHRLTSPEGNQAGDEEWQDWAEGWINFKSDTGYIELGAEKPVHSRIYQFAGTPDSWGMMPDRLTLRPGVGVVEKKTTAGIPLTIGLQTGSYRGALNEMYPRGVTFGGDSPLFKFTHRWVVWLRPHFPRGYKLISEGDTILINGKQVPLLSPNDWQTFIGLLMLKRWRERYLKTKIDNSPQEDYNQTKENTNNGTNIEWR